MATSALRITTISGSLRQGAYSEAVLNGFATMLPAHYLLKSLDIGAFPHYNEDVEKAELPEAVRLGRAQIASSDIVVIVTPEFNHGIPGVLKNTLDWLSRPVFASCFKDKPVFFATHSPGALGGVRAQYQMRETLASMQCKLPAYAEVAISYVAEKVENGSLTDTRTLDYLMTQFHAFLKGAELDR